MAELKNYKETQAGARKALRLATTAHDVGTFDAGIRRFKDGFRAGLKDGAVKGSRGQVSQQVRKFKEKAWKTGR